MDKVYVVRHKVVVEGKSISCVARELGINRNTVSKYLRGSSAFEDNSCGSDARGVGYFLRFAYLRIFGPNTC
jgi:predicted transcriptional regulator